jgi:CHASE2 domain-containing sensor protein
VKAVVRVSLVLLAIAALASAAGLLVRAAGNGVEHTTIDWRFAVRGDRPVPQDLVLVTVDPRTEVKLNRQFPPSRYDQATVVRRLTAAGARVVAYDLTLDGTTDDPDADLAIVRALRRAPAPVAAVNRYTATGEPDLLAGIAPFSSSGVRPGLVSRPANERGSWIRFQPGAGHLQSFPLAVASAARGGAPVVLPDRALIDYRGPAGHLRRVSFIRVLRGRMRARDVRGREVVVGSAAPEVQAQGRAPIGGPMFGVEIQANAVATALDGFPLRVVPRATTTWTTIGIGALLPLLLGGVGSMRRRRGAALPGPLTTLALGLLLGVAWIVASQVAFDAGHVVAFVPGAVALLVSVVGCWAASTVFERRRYRELRRRFANSDDPEAVAAVVSGEPRNADDARLRALVDGLELRELLGQGGMGKVFRARDIALQRDVAVKVILPDLADDPDFRDRFLEEARKAAGVEHPHLVPVYGFGGTGDQLFLTMRLIVGESLEQTLARRGRFDPGTATRLVERVAIALDALHAAGVVHCDVKPANVLRADADDEHPYLTDFGISRVIGADAGPGAIRGTPGYAAPEQARGDDPDRRTDVYGLGVLLFRLVTGVLPFETDDVDDCLYAHATKPRPAASVLVPGLPGGLDAVIRRAMAIEPDERFATATAFATAAREAVEDGLEGDSGIVPDRRRGGPGDGSSISTDTL